MKKYNKFLVIFLCILIALVSICFIPIRVSKLIPMVEEQVIKDFGVNIHIERLVLRLGPILKLKAPIMHVMYEDGQKFAQFDNVKFYIPWTALLKDNIKIKRIDAKNFILKISSDDKYLPQIFNNFVKKEFNDNPDIKFNEYNILYKNSANNDIYSLKGHSLELNKLLTFKNYKLKTSGNFEINAKKYISYDLFIVPNLDLQNYNYNINFIELIEQVKSLDFHSDIITDLKIYKSAENIQYSGFINIDNISVLDNLKKNPKSFIYLTLWGDKASLLSNIYTSPNNKVYVEGVVKNTKNPILDLKVKTDDINIKDLYQKLKIFTGFTIIKNINTLDGILNANFTLKGDLNKLKSNGFIKLTNVNLVADGLQINNINSDIDLSNNKVNVNKAIGYINNAPIMLKGFIDKEINLEILMDKVELKHLLPKKIGINSGSISLISNITGKLDNISHKEKLSINDLKITNNDYNLSVNSVNLDTNQSDIGQINNLLCDNKFSEQIKIPTVKFKINPESVNIPETKIYLPNSLIVAKGDIYKVNRDVNFTLNLDGFINSKDIIKIKNLSSRYPVKLQVFGNKSVQNINTQVVFEKTDIFDEPMILNLSSKIEKKIIKLEELALLSFNGNFSNDLKQNLKGVKKIVINGNIDNSKEILLKNIRMFIPQILCVHVDDNILQFKGDLFVNGNLKEPDITGQLNIQNLIQPDLKFTLSNCNLDFNKNNLVLNAPQVKIADSTLSMNALLSTSIHEAVVVKNVNIKSKFLNTDTLLMYKDMPAIKDLPLQILDGKFYSEKLLTDIYGLDLYLTAFNTDFKLNDKVLLLKNISSEVFNGKLAGSLNYDLKNEHFVSNISARNVSAEPFFNIINTRKDTISGILNFDSKLSGELTSKKSLNGDFKFIVNNGRMSTLGKIEHLLYAQNVIADNMLRTSLSVIIKALTLKDTGLFKYLQGDVELVNGIANIKMLQSQGPLMALFIKGFYNPTNDYANLVILGRLSDEILSGLGAFGDFSLNKLMIMLTGEEQKTTNFAEDFEKIPQLPVKNTKEFRSVINGILDKPSSVISFNWISYSKKTYKQKEVPLSNEKTPEFLEALPY